jgi:site-specific DNA-methyltransferase (cytosine-N4-specific)
MQRANVKKLLVKDQDSAFYTTDFGEAYLGDSLSLLKKIKSNSINLVLTSPPYALHFKKEYGNVHKNEYVEWFIKFAAEILRILKDDGSFVLNLGTSYNKGTPTQSIYHYKLIVELIERLNFHLAQEFFWYNPAKMPVPAEWVTVRRIRVKNSVEYVWWLSKTPWPKASNKNVLKPYSKDMIRLNSRGVRETQRPSGHKINKSFDDITTGGSIPPNVFEEDMLDNFMKFGNNSANDLYTVKCKENGIKIHPARFPTVLPEFFIKMLTDPGDLVVDPFAGSNTTGMVSEKLRRKWIAFDNVEEYLEASKFRFEENPQFELI